MTKQNRPGRPRIYQQVRRRTSVMWTDGLIAALNTVRGDQSISEFTEDWLRQHPQVAAQLAQQQQEK